MLKLKKGLIYCQSTTETKVIHTNHWDQIDYIILIIFFRHINCNYSPLLFQQPLKRNNYLITSWISLEELR